MTNALAVCICIIVSEIISIVITILRLRIAVENEEALEKELSETKLKLGAKAADLRDAEAEITRLNKALARNESGYHYLPKILTIPESLKSRTFSTKVFPPRGVTLDRTERLTWEARACKDLCVAMRKAGYLKGHWEDDTFGCEICTISVKVLEGDHE